MKLVNLSLFALPVLLSSCMKEELPVPAQVRGEGRSVQVCMGPGYQEQIWIDLATGATVASNNKSAWDLAFESDPAGWRIYLNGSRLMSVWHSTATDMSAPLDTAGMAAAKRIDAPSGHRDSTAIGDWRALDAIRVVDLGFNAFGAPLGMRKVRVLEVDATSYRFEVADLNGGDMRTIVLPKDASRSFTSFSFANGVVPIEPQQGTWDIVITQYTHQFYEPFLPYIVTGALVDMATTRVARIPSADFQQVTLQDTVQFPFSARRDAIGYDWKDYSFDSGSYTVFPEMVYIVQDAEGFFHKLQFTEFYGPQGQVGCPTMNILPL